MHRRIIKKYVAYYVLLLILSISVLILSVINKETVYKSKRREIIRLGDTIQSVAENGGGVKELPEYGLTEAEKEDMNYMVKRILTLYQKDKSRSVFSKVRFQNPDQVRQYYFKFLSFLPRYIAEPYYLMQYTSADEIKYGLAFAADSKMAEDIVNATHKQYQTEIDRIYNREIHPYLSELNPYHRTALIENVVVNLMQYRDNGNLDNLSYSIKTGTGVCGDYAYLFDALARKAGFKCRIVYGNKTDDELGNMHAWNAVYLNDSWYFIDCVADDAGSKTEKQMIDQENDRFIYSIENPDGVVTKAIIMF